MTAVGRGTFLAGCVLVALQMGSYCQGGLLAHWSFDEGTYNVGAGTVDDVAVGDVGNNQMQEIGSGVTMGVPGICGTAAYFDGRRYDGLPGGSDLVYIEAPPEQLKGPGRDDVGGLPALTITSWVLPTEPGFRYSLLGGRGIVRSDDSVMGHPLHMLRFMNLPQSEVGLDFLIGNGTGGWWIVRQTIPGVASADMFDGLWHMAAGVYDGSSLQLYWDGQPLGAARSLPGSAGIGPVGNHKLAIGTMPFCEDAEPFRGAIDEVRMYDVALSAGDILREYQTVIPEPATVALLAGSLLAAAWRKWRTPRAA